MDVNEVNGATWYVTANSGVQHPDERKVVEGSLGPVVQTGPHFRYLSRFFPLFLHLLNYETKFLSV